MDHPPPLKIIFAGTPDFAVPSLKALINSPHQILAVLTQPDRPSGRGQKLSESPIKKLSSSYQLPILQPETLKDPSIVMTLQKFQADLIIVIAYGLLLPKAILSIPRLGCINIHASLLPRWRGASPIQYAILMGDSESGITIMQMEEGLDTGAILHQRACAISTDDTAQTLHDRLAQLGAEELLLTLNLLAKNKIHPQAQIHEQATYAPKLTKQEARVNWQQPAILIDRKIRAFNPWPVAYTYLQENTVRIWQAKPLKSHVNNSPGTIIKNSKNSIEVATGEGILRLLVLQLPGSKPLPVSEILHARAHIFSAGTQFN